MYSDSPISQQSHDLWQHCNQLLTEIIADAPVKTASLILTSQTTLDFNNYQSFYLLKEGSLKEYYNDSLIINYETEDLVGLQGLVHNNQTCVKTDFAVIVDEYDIKELLQYIALDEARLFKWNKYLSNIIQSWQLIVCDYKQGEVEFQPEIRQYETGDKIIHQGATDNEVYTLISGSAGVMVDETQVGEVKCDEVFGALAALTGTVRTADVIATSPCMVLVVPSDRFQSLLSSRPGTVIKLIEDMARTIMDSNEQIVGLSSKT